MALFYEEYVRNFRLRIKNYNRKISIFAVTSEKLNKNRKFS